MKNIHVLPTDKPSILIKDIWKNTFSLVENFNTNHTDFKAQHIIIISDEEIKVGDWFLSLISEKPQIEKEDASFLDKDLYKKIILTTDQDLIKDGIQAIDDEFLSWFIKNPSCENVTVLQKGANTIIFPTPKNDIISDLIELERGVTITHANKQETLEEAAENFLNNSRLRNLKTLFIEGAKWQSERIYSEEDMHKLMDEYQDYLVKTNETVKTFKEWFEQFKKK